MDIYKILVDILSGTYEIKYDSMTIKISSDNKISSLMYLDKEYICVAFTDFKPKIFIDALFDVDLLCESVKISEETIVLKAVGWPAIPIPRKMIKMA